MEECIFCKIVEKKAEASVIYEDDKTVAFLDVRPANLGHTQVIPKKHASNIYEIEEEELAAVTNTVKKIAIAVKGALNADGINVGESNEPVSWQIIPHLHFHIIPRFKDDGFKESFQRKFALGANLTRDDLNKQAEEIKRLL